MKKTGSDKIKKATLEQIIAKKMQGDMDKFAIKYYHSQTLDMDIEIRKLPIAKYFEIINGFDDDNDDESVEFMNTIIYNFCPMFKENAAEAVEAYGLDEPTQLPSAVLEDQLNEIKDLVEVINSMYGMDKLEESIKNSSEVMGTNKVNSTGSAITSNEDMT